jgi:hypothetical protein
MLEAHKHLHQHLRSKFRVVGRHHGEITARIPRLECMFSFVTSSNMLALINFAMIISFDLLLEFPRQRPLESSPHVSEETSSCCLAFREGERETAGVARRRSGGGGGCLRGASTCRLLRV